MAAIPNFKPATSHQRRPSVIRRHRRGPSTVTTIAAITFGLLVGQLSISAPAYATTQPVSLGTAGTFSVYGQTGVANTGPTALSGDVGAGSAGGITGFPPGTVAGATHAGDPAAAQADTDTQTAYTDAANRAPNAGFSGDLNGQTFDAGVYDTAAAFALTGTLTLDGQGNPNAVFIFQVGAALNTAAASTVKLINDAQAANVFWQVLGAAGTGASSSFSGTILAAGAITIGANATLVGRALSQGTVTLATNTIEFAVPPTVTITGGPSAFTLNTTPTIAGTTNAPTGTAVTVTVAGQTLPTTVQAGGTWSVTAATVADGTYTVVVSVAAAIGSPGIAEQTLTVGPTQPVSLGTAGTFSVYGQTGVANTGPTALSGDVGAGSAGGITGFPPGTVAGATHAGDPAAAQADTDTQTAYTDAANRAPNAGFSGDLNGQTFDAGVYDTAAAFALTGTLTLDGQGNPNAVFIFQVGAALNTAAASTVKLINDAQAANVFWQVLGAAGTGASSSFSGTILAAGAITIGANATLVGRALSQGTVTLATNTITTPGVSGETLSIGVPASGVNLGTYAASVTGETISGLLGTVSVNDTRDGSPSTGWVVSVTATAFTPTSGPSIPASSISYTAGVITQIRGTGTYTDNQPTNLTIAVPAVTATAISGDNAEATWDPTLSIIVPGGAAPGTYSSTITYSVL